MTYSGKTGRPRPCRRCELRNNIYPRRKRYCRYTHYVLRSIHHVVPRKRDAVKSTAKSTCLRAKRPRVENIIVRNAIVKITEIVYTAYVIFRFSVLLARKEYRLPKCVFHKSYCHDESPSIPCDRLFSVTTHSKRCFCTTR